MLRPVLPSRAERVLRDIHDMEAGWRDMVRPRPRWYRREPWSSVLLGLGIVTVFPTVLYALGALGVGGAP